ncbi:MAG: ABC transporter ATP-binding protein, partial [Eudoraea sp.]
SLKNKLSTLESDIAGLEKEIAKTDHDLLMDYDTTIAIPDFFDTYQAKKKKLEELMIKWENVTLELENSGMEG